MNGDILFDLMLAIAMNVPADLDGRSLAINRPSRSVSVIRQASAVPDHLRDWASCVLDRESGGTFDRRQSGAGALNTAGSGAAGRWQFMPAWRNGLPYMVRDRLVDHGMPKAQAKKVRLYLSARPINKWPGLYQDIGAFEVMERGGRFHWAGPGC